MPSSASPTSQARKSASHALRLTPEELEAAMTVCIHKIDTNIERFGRKYPGPASIGGRYPLIENEDWTTGFWPGMLWLAFENSGAEHHRKAAQGHIASFKHRIENRFHTNHHDLGFLYTLSCVSAWKLTRDENARGAALLAADRLCERFMPRGRFIQAWGNLGEHDSYRLIIDSLMNLPLLFWATAESGKSSYREIAEQHMRTTIKHIVRPDFSTIHTFFFDPETGAPLHGVTHQGHGDNSCWSRGQAWAISGLPLCRLHSDDAELMSLFNRVTDYFLNRLPQDSVCYWDLVFTSGKEPRDSSAAAIAACGLLESHKHLPAGAERDRYENAAHQILRSLIKNYMATDAEDGLLLHAVYSKPHKSGVDECCIWGDYFFLEALTRLRRNWKPYW